MRKPSVRFRDRIFAHVIALVFLVGFPAAVTWAAPVTWMTFTRHDGRVEMRAKVCMFFVLPFRHEDIAEVTGVDEQTIAGTREKWNMGTADDQKRDMTTESEGTLIVQGRGEEARISVSPASLSDVKEKVRDFLKDTGAAKLQLFAPANWKVSVVVGSFVCLFTVLYVVGLLSWLVPSSWQKSGATRRRFPAS
jgi:hypothetical protein